MITDSIFSKRGILRTWKILFFISIVVSMFVLFYNRELNALENLFFLPFTYAFSLLIMRKVFIKQPGLALLIIEIIMVCRYLILPVLFAFDKNYTGVTISGADYAQATWLMVYELVIVSLTMSCWVSVKHEKLSIKEKKENNFFRYSTVLVILFWFFIILTNDKLRGNLFKFRLLTREEISSQGFISMNEYLSDIPGVYLIFFKIGLIVLLTTSVQFIAKIKLHKFIKASILLVICILFISSMWSNGYSVSRWGMIIATIISIFVLMNSFPEKKKLIVLCGVVGVVILILIGSLLKTFSHGNVDYTLSDSTSTYLTSEYFDEYFGGIAPVANGIRVAETYGSGRGLEGLFVDNFFNFPYAMKILGLSNENTANDYFQNLTGHYDLIMPNITISLMQFGWIFSPVYSVLVVILAFWFDLKRKMALSLYRQLFYTVLVFWTSLFMALNVNIIDANIWYAVIGLWVIYIEEKVRILKKKHL